MGVINAAGSFMGKEFKGSFTNFSTGFANEAGGVINAAKGSGKSAVKQALHSNEGINRSFFSNLSSGFADATSGIRGMMNGKGIKEAHRNPDGSWNKAAIAGTAYAAYTGIDAANRWFNGGNLTHNAAGERDIIGIPLI